jgi:hypothetical protein
VRSTTIRITRVVAKKAANPLPFPRTLKPNKGLSTFRKLEFVAFQCEIPDGDPHRGGYRDRSQRSIVGQTRPDRGEDCERQHDRGNHDHNEL